MKILVVGSGAREHAIVHSLAQESPAGGQHELHAAPGNPGIAGLATLHRVDALDGRAVAELALSIGAGLVVVGPEAPLVAGVADAVRAAGIPVFGPSADAARLEGSKAFAKEVMAAAGVPTAQAVVCSTLEQVGDALDEFGAPYVVKDDGLAAGKGVVVTDDRAAALAHAAECFANPDRGGDPRVVIEEFLDGPEVSLFCISDGQSVVPLAPAQDFKRAFDGDDGPNTGGMGAYSPLPWAPVGLVEQVVETVAQPTIDEMAARGTPFAGVLYVGLALTSKGPRVIEFNARFGDPETQVVLSRLVTPLSELLLAASTGTLAGLPSLQWSDNAAVTVVVASNGYPSAPTYGDPITGVAEADALSGVHVLHAGTAVSGTGGLVSAGGRVLSVVGVGADLRAARRLAYAGVERIALPGAHHRSDIAETAAAGFQLGSDALDLAGWRHIYSGKVRDLYEPDLAHYGGVHPLGDVLLVVASDRVSAHDFVLSPGIPDKGTILTQLSLWWFEQLSDLVGNHVVSTEISAMPGDGLVPDEVAGRAMICRRLEMFPVECVARGYLTGSGLVEYRANRSVCGVELPDGLVDGSRLPVPIFTPASKAEVGEHDENVSFEVVAAKIGEASANRLRELTLAVYARAEQIARARGVILADTKLEFGIDPATGEIVLGDEVLTPDSSRFWALDTWKPGQSQPSFDKQPIRDWLVSPDSGWDRTGEQPPPELPAAVVDATRDRYLAAYRLLTGDKLSEHVRRP